MLFLVKIKNGCGDHIAAIIEAKDTITALAFARSLPDWPLDWDDVEISRYFKPHKWPEWLVDFEDYDHECPNDWPKY